jgi:hypothetical protein
MTPSEPTDPTPPDEASVSPLEELRERLRPRALQGAGDPRVTVGERFALERLQALELQIATAHRRERELMELAIRDGNQISSLQAKAASLSDLAARTEAAERSMYESESRAENAVRRSELMESELMSTRSEVDRLRSRVVELEASLRRSLAEIGELTSARAQAAPEAAEEVARMEDSAHRTLELADRLRLKVVDLESSLLSVMSGVGDATVQRLRAEDADEGALPVEQTLAVDLAESSGTDAEERLADLEERLASLDARIAGLSESMKQEQPDLVVDLRDAEADEEPEAEQEPSPEPIKPPASRWSDWRTT